MDLWEIIDFLRHLNPSLNIEEIRHLLTNRNSKYETYSNIAVWAKILNKINPALVIYRNLYYLLASSSDNDLAIVSRCIRILTPARITPDRCELLSDAIYALYYSICTLDNAKYSEGLHGVLLIKRNDALEKARIGGERAVNTIHSIIAEFTESVIPVPTPAHPIPETLSISTDVISSVPLPIGLNATILRRAELQGINVDLGDKCYDYECPFTGEIMNVPTFNNNPDSITPQRAERHAMLRIARDREKDPWTRRLMTEVHLETDQQLQREIHEFVFEKLQQLRAIPGFENAYPEFDLVVSTSTLSPPI